VQDPVCKGGSLSSRLREVILQCLDQIKPMSNKESEENKRGNHWFSNFGHDRQIKPVSLLT
jgi:hypothetical protein